MRRYLILAHQTATSLELGRKVRAIARDEPESLFTLLVPAVPLHHWGTRDETKVRAYAEEQGRLGRDMLEAEGAKDVSTVVGAPAPMDALADELRDGPGYDELIICTLAPGISKWLKLDLPHQAARRFNLPMTHVVASARLPATA